MTAEASPCPLGYPCVDAELCLRTGLGMDPEMADRAKRLGLVVSRIEGDDMPFLDICEAPITQGYLTSQAEAAQNLHPELAAQGYEAVMGDARQVQQALDDIDGGPARQWQY